MNAVIYPKLTEQDFRTLSYVHPLLSGAVLLAARGFFTSARCYRVTSGLRTPEEQEALWRAGKTSLRSGSKHQLGHAVDLAVLSGDRKTASWAIDDYKTLDLYMQAGFDALTFGGVELVWGGRWKSVDATHWELRF